jgi:phage terminase large subunit
MGLDDEQRIHGMKSDAFWLNEAIEASFEDYAQLMQRCDGFAVLDYNPSEEEHWIYDKLCHRPKTYYSHSTMLDNRLVSQNAREQILSYEPTEENYTQGTADKRKWDIYGLGKRAKIEGLVFDYITLIDHIPKFVRHIAGGIDFGYSNDVTSAGVVGIDGNSLYVDEVCYQTHMLSGDIVRVLKENRELTRNQGSGAQGGTRIWADSADPRLITELHNAGFNIRGVVKGSGSIDAGLDKMKSMKIHVTTSSLATIKEFKNYTYRQDRQGKWLNKPIDAFNHSIDWIRYVVLMEVLGRTRKKSNIRQYFK